MPIYNYQPAERSCPQCGTAYLVGGRGNRQANAKFCSKRCAAAGRVLAPTVTTLTPTQAAYVAGLLDGEGSIVSFMRPGGIHRQIRVVIVNTDRPVIDWLAETVGGNVNTVTRRYTNFKRDPKPVFTWVVNGHNAIALLGQLLPFLIIKRDKALAAIESQARPHQT